MYTRERGIASWMPENFRSSFGYWQWFARVTLAKRQNELEPKLRLLVSNYPLNPIQYSTREDKTAYVKEEPSLHRTVLFLVPNFEKLT
jgi:hypothetical protein